MKRYVEVPRAIRDMYQTALARYVEIARQRSGKPVPMFPLIFRQMGRCAGQVITDLIKGSEVRINPDFFKDEARAKEQFEVTLPHEVAHAVVDFLYPLIKPTDGLRELTSLMTRRGRLQRKVDPHGNEWRMVMGWYGFPNPEVRHQMSMDGVAVKKSAPRERPFKYLCGCREHMMTLTLHERMQKGQKRFCRLCRGRLVFHRQYGKPAINLNPPKVTPAVVVPSKPSPPATHKWVTRFVDGSLQNIRIPLTPEELKVQS